MSNIGFRIYTEFDRPEKELVEGFKGIPVANIGDCMNRFACMDARIKPVNKQHILGSAFTVKIRAGDNLMIQKALGLALPGDVIVVDGQGDMVHALMGEIMIRQAKKNGLAGVVIDGAIRDSEALSEMDFPVYAIGCTPNGPYRDGPGEINVPITCGGIVIKPGDIIIGDADGVIVIDPIDALELQKKAKSKLLAETDTFERIENGTLDRSWVDKSLKEKGCEIIDTREVKSNTRKCQND